MITLHMEPVSLSSFFFFLFNLLYINCLNLGFKILYDNCLNFGFKINSETIMEGGNFCRVQFFWFPTGGHNYRSPVGSPNRGFSTPLTSNYKYVIQAK